MSSDFEDLPLVAEDGADLIRPGAERPPWRPHRLAEGPLTADNLARGIVRPGVDAGQAALRYCTHDELGEL